MTLADISSLNSAVLWWAFGLSVAFGAIAQKTNFCTMGAISDVVNMGDWTRVRMWALAAGVGMVGFGVLAGTGVIDASKTLYASPRLAWASALVGGALFGFGMVLASGCGSKTLVRMGGGSLKAVVVFVVMGVAAFATLKGITAVLRVATVDQIAINVGAFHAISTAIFGLFDLRSQQSVLWGGVLLGGALCAWALAAKDMRRTDGLLAGLGLGAVVVGMWWASGKLGFVAEHPDTLQEAFLGTNSGRAEALSFVAPVAYTLDWLMFFSDKAKVVTLGIASVVGVVLGSGAVAVLTQTFRFEGFGGVEDVGNHLVGAVLMGVGGVTAMGCTVGQGLSGLSTLSFMSILAVLAIVGGAVAALKYQMWRL